MFSRPIFARCLQTAFLAALLMLTFSASAFAQSASVLTQHNDAQRTGANLKETLLNTSSVNASQFGKIFTRVLDGHLYAQPLYVPNVTIQGQKHNVVYVATAHNTVYAFDADDPAQSAPLWSVSLGPSVPSSLIGTPNILIEVGIIATPVISTVTDGVGNNTGVIYVTAKTLENRVQIWRLHALDITTGLPVNGSPVKISAVVPGTGDGGTTVTFTAAKHNQRPGLLLLNGVVYLGFASHEDFAPYHGWVFGYSAANLQAAPSVFITTPNGGYGGIWQGGQGLVGDTTGNVYCMVGNGQPNADPNSSASNGKDYGEGFLKLTPSGANLNVTDWFLPNNWASLDAGDADLGSGGPLLLPGTHYLVGGGKQGLFYVVDTAKMGHFQASSDSQIVQSFQGWNGEYRGGFAYWNSPNNGPMVYVWGGSDVGKAYAFSNGFFGTSPATQTNNLLSQGASNSPGLSVSANGSAAGTGILWATMSYAGDSDHATVPGVLRAFDASNLSVELWNSNQSPSDALGNWAKFDPPTIANGKVYAPTDSNRLVVYGLLPHTAPDAPTNLAALPGNALVALNWTAASHTTGYNIRRSLTSGGPYTTIASNVSNPYYTDSTVSNNVTYYYVVTAVNAYGESGPSVEASAKPNVSAVGNAFGIQFVGNAAPIIAGESAGVISVSNWNNATGSSGTLAQAKDNLGLPSGVSVSYASAGTWTIGLPDAPGNIRLMNGYLDTSDTSTTTVTVSGLPTSFVSNGYDVYVYCNSDGTNRAGIYKIGGASIQAQDNAQFNGTFVQANNSAGNYVLFSGQSGSGFTLTATPDQSVGGFRAPVNAIQIVSRAASLPAPTNLTATAGNAQVALTWMASPGANSYSVKRSAVTGGPYTTVANGISAASYTDKSVTNGATYFYVVSASSSSASSGNSNEASATPQTPDFGLTVNPGSVVLLQGASSTATVAAQSLGGFSGPVTLSLSGLPPGVTATLTPAVISTGGQSAVTLTAAPTAPLTTATITVSAVSGALSHSATFTVRVVAPANAGNGIFGINFQGGFGAGADNTPLGAAEIAGVVPTANWNNAPGQSGTLNALADSGGAATAVAITWDSNNIWDNGIADSPGDFRLMKGYLDTNNNTTTTVTVSGLDPTMPYDFYLYANGDNGGREGVYSIGNQAVYIAENAVFSGTYVLSTGTTPTDPNATGNYAVLRVSGSNTYTLTATPEQTTSGMRAPLNAVQIIAVGRTVSGTVTLEGAVNPAQPLTFIFRDVATGNPLLTRTQTLAPVVGASSGTFQFTGLPAAKYNLAIKGAINLRKVVPVSTVSGDVKNVVAILPAGDANNDNSVDSTDFGILIGAFNTSASVPGSGYDATADFNFDGLVDSTDFGLLIGEFNNVGDN